MKRTIFILIAVVAMVVTAFVVSSEAQGEATAKPLFRDRFQVP